VSQSLLTPHPVRWVTIDNPDSDEPVLPSGYVYNQGLAKGAAQFARLEGCWYGDNSIYFNATTGGNAGVGQVWQYHIRRNELQLVFESPSSDVLNSPDNICVSPRGGLVICEDGIETNFVRGLTRDGRVFDVVRNNLDRSEWAGACFSPQGAGGEGGILLLGTRLGARVLLTHHIGPPAPYHETQRLPPQCAH
jgi:hypothetical protein